MPSNHAVSSPVAVLHGEYFQIVQLSIRHGNLRDHRSPIQMGRLQFDGDQDRAFPATIPDKIVK
jgi:hypothetical protein